MRIGIQNTIRYGIPRTLQQLEAAINITDAFGEIRSLMEAFIFLLYGLHCCLEEVGEVVWE
jgi:hypothetical protein